MKKTFLIALFIIMGWLVYTNQQEIKNAFDMVYTEYFPCRKPISYSIGTLDPRFGISREDFLKDIDTAVQIWNKAVDKNLFTYSDTAHLKINLIYDNRQDITFQLKKLGIVIQNNQAGYDQLKAKYAAMEERYDQENKALNDRIQSYTMQSADYEAKVSAWKAKGGGPRQEAFQLERQRENLNEQLFFIDKEKIKIQNMIDAMNAVATSLNMIAANMNTTVEKYNGIGAQQDDEYQEGTYIRDKNSTKIDIYQFDDREMLIRALVHELGHAIGLEHIDNPESIMYRLNESTNNSLSPDDINAIKNICK